MANLTSTLSIMLKDGVTGPAGKAAGSLKALGASGKDIARLADTSPEIGRLAKQLAELRKSAEGLSAFREASKGLDGLGMAMRRDRHELARLTAELDRARKAGEALAGVKTSKSNPNAAADRTAAASEVRRLERQIRAATASAAESRSAFMEQGRAVRDLRTSLVGAGVPIETLRAKEVSLKSAIEQTTAAMTRRGRVEEVVGRRRAAAMTDADRQDRQFARAREARDLRRGYGADRAQALADVQAAREARRMARVREVRALREQYDEERIAAGVSARQVRREAAGALLSMGGIALGHKVKAGAHAVGHTYREFDKERRFGKAVMGLTDAEQKPLVDQAIHMGATTKFNDIQVLEAQRELAARGLKKDQVLGLIEPAADLGQALDLTLPNAVKQMEGALFGFKKDISTLPAALASARQTADLQVKAAKSSGMTPEDLSQAYKYGATPARMAGVSEQLLLAFAGVAKKANIGGDESGVAFRALLANATSPTRKAKEALLANGFDFKNYQKPPDQLALEPFVKNIAAQYGVRLDEAVQAKLRKIFSDKSVISDPALFAPAVMDVLSDELAGDDAKAKKSIAGAATRYRDASMKGIDVNAFIFDILKALPGNLQLSNALFGSKQGGRIATGLDPATIKHMLEEIGGHSEGYAGKISAERMAGFDGAVSRFEGAVMNLQSRMGASLDAGGEGGLLTGLVDRTGKLVQSMAEMDTRVLAAGSAIAWLGGKAAEAAGTFGLAVAAIGLTKASVDLSGAAAALAASAGGGVSGKVKASSALGKFGRFALGAGGYGVAIGGAIIVGSEIGQAAAGVHDVAAGKYWRPQDEEALADLRRQKAEAEAEASGVRSRLHPSRQGEPNADLDRLSAAIADLANRIASAETARASAPAASVADAISGFTPIGSAGASFGITGPLETLGAKADETKDKLKAIGDTPLVPRIEMGSLDALIGRLNEAQSAAVRLSGTLGGLGSGSIGLGSGSTGRVKAGLRDNHSAG